MYKLKDVHNVLARLKSDPKALLGGQDAAGTEEAVESDGASRTAADSAAAIVASMATELGGETGHALVPGSAELHEVGAAADGAAAAGTPVSDTTAAVQSASRTSLARLEILLDSSYTYHSAHADVSA